MVFPIVIHVWLWELDDNESWVPDNWCFWTMVLEKTLESPLDCREIQPVNSKDNQSWVFIGRPNAEPEAPIIWPLVWRTDSLEKILMLGKIEAGGKGMIEDEMFGWHHQLVGHELEQVLGGGDGQGSLRYCSFMGSQRVRQDWVTRLNWTELIAKVLKFSPERHSKCY